MTKRSISLRVPATSANLGCAFDCAAIALGLYLDVCAELRDDSAVKVRYSGVNPERIALDGNNLIAKVVTDKLAAWKLRSGLELEIQNQIPPGQGLGSSAAAILGGLLVAHQLADRPIEEETLLAEANRLEGHPDNVAAAWYGGFTVATEYGERLLACTCAVPDWLRMVVVVPNYAVPTERAREVLPERYTREDAVHNLQRAGMLTAQMFSGRFDLHSCYFDDRWHQPFRAALVPGLRDVLRLKHEELLGVCLSGAGPSVLAFTRGDALPIGRLIVDQLAAKGVESTPYILKADNRGAKNWNHLG